MPYPSNCPFCKKGNLTTFYRTPTTATLSCSSCDKLFMAKTGAGKALEVIVPALSVLVSLASIAAFFGITDAGKLKTWFNSFNSKM